MHLQTARLDVRGAVSRSDDPDARTRDRVARAVLEDGPVTASAIADQLGVTPAAVRRHLDLLAEEGLVAARDPRPSASRGRGRPARVYVVTDAGHASMTTAYDDLATSAMEFLAEQLGPEAVEEFAARRVADLESRYAPVLEAVGDDPDLRTRALADALARDGYAASARPVGSSGAGPAGEGIQLCQGHCPVQHVATRFPQLCEAETEVFSRLLGVHVQRLATLASGAHVCTTHVPTGAAPTATSTSTSTSTHLPTPSLVRPSEAPISPEPRTSDERNRS
ncbi:MAG TPA: metalloregulator ArsR/SmtB family transcription factor [Actinomycetales bacterium]|nr:metalloregulator ArsR/SmtB family transcription factor [Actinomycetales bacterium]